MVMARYLETRQCKSFISKVSRVIVFALLSHVWHTEASTKGQNPNNSPSILTRICGDTTSDMGRVRFEGAISDCSCEFDSVNNAVLSFFNPLLGLLTSSAYFRYFRVDLERPCPFWHEDAQCMMEGCSVCTCDENEVPRAWIDDFIADMDRKRMDFVPPDAIKDHGDSSISTSTSPASTSTSSSLPSSSSYRLSSNPSSENSQSTVKERNGYGWITPPASAFGGYDDTGRGTLNSSLSNLRKPLLEMDSTKKGYLNFLRQSEYDNGEDEDDMDWTDMAEDKCGGGGGRRKNVGMGKNDNDHGGGPVYVNLLQNPEGYTGYAGPSAQRVWQAIQQENCFGGGDDICLEKRVFYRLMSGLQASISTHIAKNYYFPDGTWGINLPLFMRAVGSHSDRMNNLYFTFLFVLRAVVKGGPILIEQQFYTGNSTEDKEIRLMVQKLVSARLRDDEEHIGSGSSKGIIVNEQFKDVLEGLVVGVKNAGGDTVDQCRNGFDESVLFQMPLPAPLFYANPSSYQYMSAKEEFRLRFRNVTRIMDCVACEKCRVWGKLQILGLGTAIKILLTPEEDLEAIAADLSAHHKLNDKHNARPSKAFLNRQEVVALINTLHQLSTSVAFAASAETLASQHGIKSNENGSHVNITMLLMSGMLVLIPMILYQLRLTISRRSAVYEREGEDVDEN